MELRIGDYDSTFDCGTVYSSSSFRDISALPPCRSMPPETHRNSRHFNSGLRRGSAAYVSHFSPGGLNFLGPTYHVCGIATPLGRQLYISVAAVALKRPYCSWRRLDTIIYKRHIELVILIGDVVTSGNRAVHVMRRTQNI